MDKTDTKTDTNGFFKKPQIRNPLVLLVWQGSSVGESAGFITQRSAVQICLLLPVIARDCGFVAFLKMAMSVQMVQQMVQHHLSITPHSRPGATGLLCVIDSQVIQVDKSLI